MSICESSDVISSGHVSRKITLFQPPTGDKEPDKYQSTKFVKHVPSKRLHRQDAIKKKRNGKSWNNLENTGSAMSVQIAVSVDSLVSYLDSSSDYYSGSSSMSACTNSSLEDYKVRQSEPEKVLQVEGAKKAIGTQTNEEIMKTSTLPSAASAVKSQPLSFHNRLYQKNPNRKKYNQDIYSSSKSSYYQTLTLPLNFNFSKCLQLVEFDDEEIKNFNETKSNEDLSSLKNKEFDDEDDDEDPYYETLEQNTVDEFSPGQEYHQESLYSEPIYGQSSAGSSTTSSTYWNTTTSVYDHNDSLTTPSFNSYDQNFSLSDKLPPIPKSNPTKKFATIAKSAGKKIAKNFQIIRRLSETGQGLKTLDLNVISGRNTPANGSGAQSQKLSLFSTSVPKGKTATPAASKPAIPRVPISPPIYANYPNPTKKSNVTPPKILRSISRPNIPPPEPPKPSTSSCSVSNLPRLSANLLNRSLPKIPTSSDDTLGIDGNEFSKHLSSNYTPSSDFDEDSDFYDDSSEIIRNFVSSVSQPIYSIDKNEEPLYQYYDYYATNTGFKPDPNEPESTYQPVIPKNLGLTIDMLVPRIISSSSCQRTLWSDLPEVKSSGILSVLSSKQKQMQEAIFEVLTSEVSYLKSLDVLVDLFIENDELSQAISYDDKNYLFGNIQNVQSCSKSFLDELLTKWEESWYVHEIGQIINENTLQNFHVYKEYCRNKPKQDKVMQKLRSSNDEFKAIIQSIETQPQCQHLKLDSFLMLPMQRITRLPLLVNAILVRTTQSNNNNNKEKLILEETLKNLTNLVIDCNEAARESQDAEETSSILEKMEFPRSIRSIGNPGQFLIKGEFMRNPFDTNTKSGINWTFSKSKNKKQIIYCLILFTNQLFITKKRSSKYEVIDMIPSTDSCIKSLPELEVEISKDFTHYFMLHFDKKEMVYFLASRTKSEIERWKQKLEHLKSNRRNLEVEAIFPYDAKREDELSFDVGDLIRVEEVQADGWYFGTKLGDNEGNSSQSGWFPGNYCVES